MAEITKITTPMLPKENTGNKFKPVTDQAFELTDPAKVHKPGQEGKINDRQNEAQNLLKDSMGRAAILPLLKNSNELMQVFRRIVMLMEVGVAASDAVSDTQTRELLKVLFASPENLLQALKEQDNSSVLFKGEAFDVLRDILGKFSENPKMRDALAGLLKAFEHNVNSQGSIKTILYNCNNILDYMFSKDRDQFSNYLQGLAEMLLPQEEPAKDGGQAVNLRQSQDEQAVNAQQSQPLSQKEAAQLLKNNLLPLLGEIVVKYHQNERIRDIVMVVVHNIVRVDQGTPEALREAVTKLLNELKQVVNLPEGFEKNLLDAIRQSAVDVKATQNSVISKLADIISDTLRSPGANPAMVRQAETLLISMLQNQSSMMNVLHFILPVDIGGDQVFTELYVDPDSDEKAGRGQGKSRKLFVSVESEAYGSFELSFLETDGRVDFSMWCPGALVKSFGPLKRYIGDIMQLHGYTMNSYRVEEMREPHSVAEVFPKLLEKKVGIDVRI